MTYVVIVLVLIVVLLGYMLYSQSQAGKKQTAEQQQLLCGRTAETARRLPCIGEEF